MVIWPYMGILYDHMRVVYPVTHSGSTRLQVRCQAAQGRNLIEGQSQGEQGLGLGTRVQPLSG